MVVFDIVKINGSNFLIKYETYNKINCKSSEQKHQICDIKHQKFEMKSRTLR